MAAGSRRATAAGWRTIAAAGLLAAATIWWAATPLHSGAPGTRVALIAAIASGALSVAQLAAAAVSRTGSAGHATLPRRIAGWLLGLPAAAPWPEVLLAALLALEALHPARPWHTGALAPAVLGYLLATHLAESGAQPSALRAQLPLIAAGIATLALAVVIAELPGLGAGPAASAVRIAAIAAAVVAAALAVPVGRGRPQP